jgi:septal ring factor EnvC (AmiA/AmiB activator)
MRFVLSGPRLCGAAAIAALLACGGCADNPYLDAKRNTAAGGQQERDLNAANAQLAGAQWQNASLQTARAGREQEIERNDQRIKSLQADLRRQDAALAQALKSKRITQARHDQLRRDLEALRGDSRNADLQNQAGRMAKSPDPGGDAAKEARLRELEKRKRDLELALSGASAQR